MDRQMLIHTLGVVARALTCIIWAGLYKALSPDDHPSFETVAKIVDCRCIRHPAEHASGLTWRWVSRGVDFEGGEGEIISIALVACRLKNQRLMPRVIGTNARSQVQVLSKLFAGFSVIGTQIGGSQNAPIATRHKEKLLNNQ